MIRFIWFLHVHAAFPEWNGLDQIDISMEYGMRKLIAVISGIAILAISIYYLINSIDFDELGSLLDWEDDFETDGKHDGI